MRKLLSIFLLIFLIFLIFLFTIIGCTSTKNPSRKKIEVLVSKGKSFQLLGIYNIPDSIKDYKKFFNRRPAKTNLPEEGGWYDRMTEPYCDTCFSIRGQYIDDDSGQWVGMCYRSDSTKWQIDTTKKK